jgi:pyrroloquinoline quinone biosynthesis protein E
MDAPVKPACDVPRPLGLLAELTYRCPLHCPYCSNPVHYPKGEELGTEEWQRVFREAGELGVLHALLSGGEPLQRPDLVDLVASARQSGLYVNLLTSGVGLTESRTEQLKTAGLDSVQLSFQADEEVLGNSLAGASAHAVKLSTARIVRTLRLPLTINIVLHRGNIDRIEQMIDLAEDLGAQRLELASVQFYGWAFRNRGSLLPTSEQVQRAGIAVTAAQERFGGRMEIVYVLPDYFGDRPKPCMNGWGRRYLTVNPVGEVLPCPTAGEIPGLRFENVRQRSLSWIWTESAAFNRFRGTAWMPEPCRSCDRREIDFGGCRCQAALLTGDAANTDPACALSPFRANLLKVGESAGVHFSETVQLEFRNNPSTAWSGPSA